MNSSTKKVKKKEKAKSEKSRIRLPETFVLFVHKIVRKRETNGGKRRGLGRVRECERQKKK